MFIQLTDFNTDEKVLINLDLIKNITCSETFDHTETTNDEQFDIYKLAVYFTWKNDYVTRVTETWEQIKYKLEQAKILV